MSVMWAVSHLFSHFYCLLEKFAGSLHAGHYYGCSLLWWVFVHTCKCKVQVTQKEGKEKKKMPRLGQIVCIKVGEGGSGSPKEASL